MFFLFSEQIIRGLCPKSLSGVVGGGGGWVSVEQVFTAGKDLYPNLMVPVESEGRKEEGIPDLDTFFMFIINNGCNY